MTSSQIAPHVLLPEPELAFHPDRRADSEVHPLRGLLRYGPYSKGLVPDPIRVATIAPARESDRLYAFMRELNKPARPRERRDYVPDWPGFRKVFNLEVRGAGGACHQEMDAAVEDALKSAARPHVVLADRLVRSIQLLASVDTQNRPLIDS